MSRSTQCMYLSDRALDYLKSNAARTHQYKCTDPKCGHVSGGLVIEENYASAANEGMFGDGPDLEKHLMQDGSWLYDVVQCTPWSSGPCIFLALSTSPDKKDIVQELAWTKEEINKECY